MKQLIVKLTGIAAVAAIGLLLFFPEIHARAEEPADAAAVEAGTEQEAEDLYFWTDQQLTRWTMALTVRMMAGAVDQSNGVTDPEVEMFNNSITKIRVGEPYKVFIAEFTEEEAEAATRTLGIYERSFLAPAMARNINLQFGTAYDETVEPLTQTINPDLPDVPVTLVLIPYRDHVVAASYADNIVSSSMIISDMEVSENLSIDEINKDAEEFDVHNLTIRCYEGDDLERLLSLEPETPEEADTFDPWSIRSASGEDVAKTISMSKERMEILFPDLCGSARIPVDICRDAISRYITGQDDYDAVLFAANELFPLLDSRISEAAEAEKETEETTGEEGNPEEESTGEEGKPEETSGDDDTSGAKAALAANHRSFLLLDDGITDAQLEKHPAPEFEFHDTEIDPDATYVFLIERRYPDGESVTGYDLTLETVLPPHNIPAAPEEADYIIRSVITWDGDKYVSGENTVYYAYTHTAIYDAATGNMIRDCGTKEKPLAGFMMVYSRNTYLTPLRSMIWDQVKTYFEDQ